MDLKLTDKVALVTGTGSQIGYGKAIAITLAQEGCDIISADIDIDGAKQTASEVEATGRRAMAAKVDVRNRSEVEEMVKQAVEKFSRIDILINNAGVSNKGKPFTEMTREEWDYDMGVNFYGQMNVAQAVLPHMISRKSGRIINTSGGQGIPGISLYGASKGGRGSMDKSAGEGSSPVWDYCLRLFPRPGGYRPYRQRPKRDGEFSQDVSAREALHTGRRRAFGSFYGLGCQCLLCGDVRGRRRSLKVL